MPYADDNAARQAIDFFFQFELRRNACRQESHRTPEAAAARGRGGETVEALKEAGQDNGREYACSKRIKTIIKRKWVQKCSIHTPPGLPLRPARNIKQHRKTELNCVESHDIDEGQQSNRYKGLLRSPSTISPLHTHVYGKTILCTSE